MKAQLEQLLFDNLYKQAISEWPESLSLELESHVFDCAIETDKGYDLIRYKTLPWDKNPEDYVVKDLLDLCDTIMKKHYEHHQEILMVNLHYKIFSTIADAAKYILHLKLQDFRPDIVRQKFEALLKEGIEEQRDDWNEQDFQLARDYFAVNYPDQVKY